MLTHSLRACWKGNDRRMANSSNAWSAKWDVFKTPDLVNASPQEESQLRRQFKDYASNSTIHGLAYMAEPGRPLSER